MVQNCNLNRLTFQKVRLEAMKPLTMKSLRDSVFAARAARAKRQERASHTFEIMDEDFEDISQYTPPKVEEGEVCYIDDDDDEAEIFMEPLLLPKAEPLVPKAEPKPPVKQSTVVPIPKLQVPQQRASWDSSPTNETAPSKQLISAAGKRNYFLAFLEYAQIRSEDYSGREKRKMMDAMTQAMNAIDDSREAIDSFIELDHEF